MYRLGQFNEVRIHHNHVVILIKFGHLLRLNLVLNGEERKEVGIPIKHLFVSINLLSERGVIVHGLTETINLLLLKKIENVVSF